MFGFLSNNRDIKKKVYARTKTLECQKNYFSQTLQVQGQVQKTISRWNTHTKGTAGGYSSAVTETRGSSPKAELAGAPVRSARLIAALGPHEGLR